MAFRFSARCALFILAFAAFSAEAQNTASTAALDAPTAIASTTACTASQVAFANAKAMTALREESISDHHRPVPILRLPGLAPSDETAVAKPPETVVVDADTASIELTRSTPLAVVAGLTSAVTEPTAATRGNEVLMTGNWYAATSTDGGATFTCVNAYQTFPKSANGQDFCCDQVALFDRGRDLMVWLLQYARKTTTGASKENILRLAVATGADVAAGRYRYYDIAPSKFGGSTNEWFDYPDLLATDGHIYITTNAFSTIGKLPFTRSVVIRMPSDRIQQYQSLNAQYYSPSGAGTLRLAQGSTTIAYFATHAYKGGSDYLRVYAWPGAENSITSSDVQVESWNSNATAPGPDGYDWLRRNDARITAGWISGGTLGFAWTGAQNSSYSYPQVRVALISAAQMSIVAQPHLWNPDFAFAYPAASPNGNGEIGFGVFYGGNKTHPSYAVGRLLRSSTNVHSWELVRAATGTDGPSDEKWGDYHSVRAHGSTPALWVASGYALSGGSDQDNVEPRYIEFRVRPESAVDNVEDKIRELVLETERLNTVVKQQPENVRAIERLVERVQRHIDALQGPAASGGDHSGSLLQQWSIADTHRPTPADTKGMPVSRKLSATEVTLIVTAAERVLERLRTRIEGVRNTASERRLAEDLQKTVSPLVQPPLR